MVKEKDYKSNSIINELLDKQDFSNLDEIIKENSTKVESPFKNIIRRGHNPRWNANTLIKKQNALIIKNAPKESFDSEYIASQKAKLHQNAMEHKEDFYKQKFPENEEIPKGIQDYKNNIFEKMFQANIDVQKRANEQMKMQQELTTQQMNFNQAMWGTYEKEKQKAKAREKLIKETTESIERNTSMGSFAGMDKDIIDQWNARSKRLLMEELNKNE